MRVVAGRWRGRRLVTPAGRAVRPTSDRLRETLFNILTHRPGLPPLAGARVADLFAGTGALGIEALSRGAREAVFVERSPAARRMIGENLIRLGLGEHGDPPARILAADATRLPAADAPYDIILLDPPYRQGLVPAALASLVRGDWLAPGAVVVIETARDEPPPAVPAELEPLEERPVGDARLTLLRFGHALA